MAYGTINEPLIFPQATETPVTPAPARLEDPNEIIINPSSNWWDPKNPDCLFNNDFYRNGDNSKEGYRSGESKTLKERTAAEVEGVIRLLDLKPGSKILDLPCGYGRHSIGLTEQNMDVTGLDINPAHLTQAKAEAIIKDLKVDFREGNMLTLDAQNEYDALINMFYSFGFFGTDQENFQVLRNFYNALKEGGQFLMHTDVNIPRILDGTYKVDEIRELTSQGALRIIDKYNSSTKRIDGTWIIQNPDAEPQKRDYSVRVYTQEEFVDMCHAAGFKDCKSYSEWDGTAYHPKSEDMMIVATK